MGSSEKGAYFRVHASKSETDQNPQIRVFVINPGTPNAECGVSYCPPDAVEATDTALKFDLLTAYVDELSAPYLEDAEIDFVTDQLGAKLTLKA
ncbi:iron-sulfur cluster biosynthesis family protein, partial [Escherichia coli]|uniref:iron-sulfur cluster biosynthesis family protein n=1 Tax=Escherichia coli TaxID=562 RepID=UPI0024BA7ACF